MVKYIISEKGKAWRIEREDEVLVGKFVGDEFEGKELMPELEGYKLHITGGSDIAGFPLSRDVEGLGLKRVLLRKGWGMKTPGDGLRLRKTVRGKTISNTTAQINILVVKAGSKPLAEIFSDQNKPKEEVKKEAVKPAEVPAVAA